MFSLFLPVLMLSSPAHAQEAEAVTVYALSLVYGERTSTPVATTGVNTDVYKQDGWQCIALLNTGAPVNMASLLCTEGSSSVSVEVKCDDESRRISTMNLVKDHTTIATVGLVCSNAQPSQPQKMRGVYAGP